MFAILYSQKTRYKKKYTCFAKRHEQKLIDMVYITARTLYIEFIHLLCTNLFYKRVYNFFFF